MNVTAAEVGLEFNRPATPGDLPTPDAVAQTLVDAVSTPNNTFNLSVQSSSIQVIVQQQLLGSTTTGATTTTTTETPSPVVVLGATLEEPFVEEYNDRNSPQFMRLEAVVVQAVSTMFKLKLSSFAAVLVLI